MYKALEILGFSDLVTKNIENPLHMLNNIIYRSSRRIFRICVPSKIYYKIEDAMAPTMSFVYGKGFNTIMYRGMPILEDQDCALNYMVYYI